MTIDETQQSVTEDVHAQTSSQSPLRRQNSNSDNQSVKFRVILMLSRGMRLAYGLILYSLLNDDMNTEFALLSVHILLIKTSSKSIRASFFIFILSNKLMLVRISESMGMFN